MVSLQLRAQRAALQNLRTPTTASCRASRLPATLTRAYATEIEPGKQNKPAARQSNETKVGRSFQGQVMGSIGARLRREKEQRAQYEEWRNLTDPTRNWMMTFVFLSGVGISYWLGTYWPREPEPSSTLPLGKTTAPKHNTKLENMQAAWADFVKIVGQDNVSTAENDIEHHATSSWSSHQAGPEDRPFCVVYPSTTEEVSEIMKVCHRRRIPVTGYSGGTSLEGHFTPTRKGISIDFGRMNKIINLHKEDLDVVVQPAMGWEALNDHLGQQGLFFPPDPGPGAMIGGMIGTGCSGTNAYRYGTMREWVLSLTVVLADGTVIKTRQRPRKSSAGYDLTKLFIGSEGTLGLVTEATLKVTVKPESTSVAVCSFPSIRHAANCVSKVVGQGIPVAAVEILDDNQMKCINEAGMTSKAWAEAATLFFKFAGTPAGVKEQIAQVQGLAKKAGSKTFEFAKSQEEQEELWSARKEALWSTMAVKKPGDHVWTGDVAVPMSKLPDLIEATKEDMAKSGLFASIVGHVGDGNFHTILLYNDSERPKAEAVVHRMVKKAVEMEGTVTGEHGVGLVKRDYLSHELGETTVDAMRQIKKAYDPLCLLNCDKVVTGDKVLTIAAEERTMPTDKGKAKVKANPANKEDDRRKVIDDLHAKIQSLYTMNDEINKSLQESRDHLENIHRKRVKNMKSRLEKMIDKGDVQPLGTDCSVHGLHSQLNLNLTQDQGQGQSQNQGQSQGQSQGLEASTWPAVPEDFADDEDFWYVLDQSNLTRNIKLMPCLVEHFAQLLRFSENDMGQWDR
ncbi:d-lactate dehydrogenase cytochrome [Fusarium longipes]|uniref:D-lactate dehydrogenase (cytochrome) n=1 Tax=Fusarium longipes TaxID=694270 RepID=A0A395SQQ8_9HYPO|nr:d-lactate dehydrogenase cytochrome [Fusarium longipes]